MSRNYLKKKYILLLDKVVDKNIQTRMLCNYEGIKSWSKHIADKAMTVGARTVESKIISLPYKKLSLSKQKRDVDRFMWR